MTARSDQAPAATEAPKGEPSLAARFFDSDIWYSFTRSKFTMVAPR